MELLQIHYFLKIAETGNMTKAAEELYISQSSLSRTIARLEADLGVKLFDRVGRQIYLNDFGKIFLHHARQIFFHLDEAQREIADLQGASNHNINVGFTIPGVLTFFLDRYIYLHDQIKLSQFFLQRNQAVQQLTDDTVDYVITADNISNADIEWHSLFTDSILALLPLNHPLIEHKILSLSQLVGEPIVSTPHGYGIRPLMEDCFSTVGAMPNIVFEETDPTLIFKIVQNGIGIGFITQHNLVNHLKSDNRLDNPSIPGIEMRVIRDSCANMEVGIAYLKSRYLSSQDHLFLSLLKEYCNDLSSVMHPNDYNPPS